MKYIIGLSLLFAVGFICLVLALDDLQDSFNKKEDGYKQFVGAKVVIDKDTLIVTDYSLIQNNYQLSNGTNVAPEILLKFRVK